jgi:hypothetical protein
MVSATPIRISFRGMAQRCAGACAGQRSQHSRARRAAALTADADHRGGNRLPETQGFHDLLVTHDAEEALFLANRVIVLSDRPARVKADIVVDRPYPRHRGDPYLADLRKQILGLLGLDATW